MTTNLATLKTLSLNDLDEQVSRAKEGSRLTRKGHDLLAKAVAGQELKYTRIAYGDSTRDGQFVDVSIEDAFELNDLVNWRMDLPISDCSFTGGGTAALKFAVRNANVEKSFWIRETGVFAEDPDTGEEVLYAYRNVGLAGEAIPAGNGAVLWDFTETIITVIDSATNVTAVISENLAYVSQNEFTQHVNSTNPHPNIPVVMGDVETTSAVWAIDEDSNLHKLPAEKLARQILGGDAGDIPKMNSRLTQAEVNLSNLYMQLNADKELGLQANLLMIEDFTENKNCDLYSCKVLTAVAGVANIQLESDRDILSGCWYTITDGVNSEYVQVRSVIRNGNAYVVVLEQTLAHTYNLDCTIFMRSTTQISTNQAQGAGDIRGVNYTFDEVWRGTGGNVATTLAIDFTQGNAAAFSVDGDGTFAGGEFTLAG